MLATLLSLVVQSIARYFDSFDVPYSMCSLAVSTLDSPVVDKRSNPGSGKILMSDKSQAVYYISSCHVLIDKVLSSD